MEQSPGLEVLGTTSLPEEPTFLPGVDLKCGSPASRRRSPSSSDLPVLTQDTLVCTEAMEALTNGVNNNRAVIKGTSSKDMTTTTRHTIRANTLSNTLLLPLTEPLNQITMLTRSQLSPAITTIRTNQHSLLPRSSTSPFALLVRPADCRPPSVQLCLDSRLYGIPSWWFVRTFT